MTALTRCRRCRRGEAGSEIIECALALPLVLMVALGIVDFGLLFQQYEVLTNAAHEGARVAVLPGYSNTDVQARVTSYLTEAGLPVSPTVAVTNTTITDGTTTWPATTVNVSYPHQYLFLSGIAGWYGGSLTAVTMNAGATMRNVFLTGP